MLSEKLPKKIRGEFLGTLHTNFNNEAVVWIITKQTADKLVFFLQVIIVVAGGLIIFLFVRHRLILREKKIVEELTEKLKKESGTDKKRLL